MQKDGPSASAAVIGFGEEKRSGVCQRAREGGRTEECDTQSSAACPLVACQLESWHCEELDRLERKKKEKKRKIQINLIWGLDVIPHKAAASLCSFFFLSFPVLNSTDCPLVRFRSLVYFLSLHPLMRKEKKLAQFGFFFFFLISSAFPLSGLLHFQLSHQIASG